MKKVIAIILSAIICLSLCSCGTNTPSSTNNDLVTESNNVTDSSTTNLATEVVTTMVETTAASKMWEIGHYVDDFNQPTDEWYIVNSTYFLGTFSNSAANNAVLYAEVLVDSNKDIAFFLYEYGRNTVKNSSENYVDEYDIVMRTPDGKDHELTGTLYCGDDRIFIDDEYVNTVLNALSGDGNVMFRLVKSDRTVENYLFTVVTGNFSELYTAQTAQ